MAEIAGADGQNVGRFCWFVTINGTGTTARTNSAVQHDDSALGDKGGVLAANLSAVLRAGSEDALQALAVTPR